MVRHAWRAGLLCLAPLNVLAQAAAAAPDPRPQSPWVLDLGLEGSYVESRGRIDAGNGREFVATLTPGMSYRSRSGRLQGTVDYQAAIRTSRGYADTAGTDVENRLSSALVAEIISKRLSLEVQGTIAQQQISAYGEQSVDGPTLARRNRTETGSLTLSPVLKGQVGDVAEYELRLRGNVTRSRDAAGTDSDARGADVDLHSPSSGALFGWLVRASTERVTYDGREPVNTARGVVGLVARPQPDLRLTLRGGRESQGEGSASDVTWGNTYGGGLEWQPTPRTQLQIDADQRYFGRAGRFALSHRTARSILTYGYSRDTTRSALQTTQAVTQYDQLFSQLTSLVPNPVDRDEAVRRQLVEAQLDGAQVLVPEVQTSSVSLQQRQDLGYTWLGARTTLSAQAYTSSVSGLVFVSGEEPVATEATRQHGYSAQLTYRLTETTGVQFGGSRRMTFGTRTLAGTDLKNAFASWTQRTGLRTSTSLGARYTVFNSETSPYRETALTASLNLRF